MVDNLQPHEPPVVEGSDVYDEDVLVEILLVAYATAPNKICEEALSKTEELDPEFVKSYRQQLENVGAYADILEVILGI